MMYRAARILAAALVLQTSLSIPTAHADWMNLTGSETAPNIAEITVLDDRVQIALEVYVGDISTFDALLPDDWLKEDTAGRSSQSERLQQFATNTLQIVTADGTKLPARLTLAEPRLRKDRNAPFAGMLDPVTQQRLPGPPDDKRVLYAELEYPFTGKPQQLTFIPPLDAQGRPAVTIGFIAYHKSVPVIDFRYLTQPETLTLDWDDPWYTEFTNTALKRHHKSALMSFLYLEPREVRHEVLVRVRDLQEWTDLGLSNETTIDSADQIRIREQASVFFAAHNPLAIDSSPVEPSFTQVEFLELSLVGVQVIEDPRPLDLSTALLGIILTYPVNHLPQAVAVHWELFTERLAQIPAIAIDPAGPFPSVIEAGDPTFEWRNFLLDFQEPDVAPVIHDDRRSISLPLLSTLLLIAALGAVSLAIRPLWLSRITWIAGASMGVVGALLTLPVAIVEIPNPITGAPDEVTSAQILSSILANVNNAYLETDRDALLKALLVVVAPEAITDVGAELDRALAIKIVGGGIAQVDTVNNVVLKDLATLEDRPGFRGLAEWTAEASAGHWGHTHDRTLRFRALVEVVDDGGSWKLAGITVTDARLEI